MTDLDKEAVAARAFALYVRRGRQPGKATDDWLEAERQIRAETTGKAQPGVASKSMTAPVSVKAQPAIPAPASRPIPAPVAAVRPMVASAKPPAAPAPVPAAPPKPNPLLAKPSPAPARPAPTPAKPASPAQKQGGGKKGKNKRR